MTPTYDISNPNLRKINRFVTAAKRTNELDNLTVIIPAAGPGTRMKLHGPKCLLEYKGETLLERQIRILRSTYKNCDIIVVVGFEWKKIVQKVWPSVRFVINESYESTNVAKSISLGLQAAQQSNLLILYGDLIFDVDILKNINWPSPYLVYEDRGLFKQSEVGIAHNNSRVTNLAYSLTDKWCQMMFVNKQNYYDFVVNFINNSNKSFFGYEVLNQMIDSGYEINIRKNDNYFIRDIDTIQDFESLNKATIQ